MVGQRVEAGATERLSAGFRERLETFVGWDEDWDGLGAARIRQATAARAKHVAELALKVAPEPFVAPAGDGSLMLEWELPNGAVVGVFIPADADGESWEPASVTRGDDVAEHDIQSVADLVELIRRAAAARA